MNLETCFWFGYMITYFHIIFLMLMFIRDRIDGLSVETVKKYMWLYPVAITILYITLDVDNISLLIIHMFYFSTSMLLFNMGWNFDYLILGITSSMFISEYYEIPIHAFLFYTNKSLSIHPYVILSKLLILFYVVYIMNELRFNCKKFITGLCLFSIVYIPLGIHLISQYSFISYTISYIMLWGMKIISYAYILLFTYSESRKWGAF